MDDSQNELAYNESAYRTNYSQATSAIKTGDDVSHRRRDKQDSYFLFKSCRMRRTTLTALVTGFLVIALIMERFCFIVSVYKTRYCAYVLILIVIFLNCIFNFVLSRMQKKPQRKRLHEIFNIERAPQVSYFTTGLIG